MNATHRNTKVIVFFMTPVLQFFKFFVGEETVKLRKRLRLRRRRRKNVEIHIFMRVVEGRKGKSLLTVHD